MDIIEKAYKFMLNKHIRQVDDDNELYYKHPLRVYFILKNISHDTNVLCAGLLHDTIEDTNTTYEEIKKEFNYIIADLVLEVSHEKTDKGNIFPRLHSRDAILIKYADRLDNLCRMDSWAIDRRNHYLRKSKFWKSSINDKISEGQK